MNTFFLLTVGRAVWRDRLRLARAVYPGGGVRTARTLALRTRSVLSSPPRRRYTLARSFPVHYILVRGRHKLQTILQKQ